MDLNFFFHGFDSLYEWVDRNHSSEFFTVISVVIWLSLLKSSSTRMLLTWLFRLPFTVAHELTHYIIALIFNGHPTSISILPRREGGLITLGEVSARNVTWYNAAPIGLSPFLLLILSYFIGVGYLNSYPLSYLEHFFYIGLQSLLLVSAFPSRPDWRVALSSPFGFVFYAFAFYVFISYILYLRIL